MQLVWLTVYAPREGGKGWTNLTRFIKGGWEAWINFTVWSYESSKFLWDVLFCFLNPWLYSWLPAFFTTAGRLLCAACLAYSLCSKGGWEGWTNLTRFDKGGWEAWIYFIVWSYERSKFLWDVLFCFLNPWFYSWLPAFFITAGRLLCAACLAYSLCSKGGWEGWNNLTRFDKGGWEAWTNFITR